MSGNKRGFLTQCFLIGPKECILGFLPFPFEAAVTLSHRCTAFRVLVRNIVRLMKHEITL